ncbi:sirohydrochlorin chelatase [Nocardiopsis coralliicola]
MAPPPHPPSGPVGAPPGPDHPPLLLTAHGSADPRSPQTVRRIAARVRSLRPGTEVRTAFLERSAPSVGDELAGLAAGGARAAVVVPALLTAAYHSGTDLPAALDRAREQWPRLRLEQAGVLGPHPLLLEAAERRLAEAGAAPGPDTALVLASAGSSDPAANRVVAGAAAALAARGGWRCAVPAYASMADPAPGEAVAALLEGPDAPARVAVLPYLLAPGFFADRVRTQALGAGGGAVTVAEALGDAPELARLVLHRYDEVRSRLPAAAAAH